MARASTAMRLEDLREDSPVLHHQYALSQVLQRRGVGGHSRSQPTQLVYPDGSIAIGFPPASLKRTSFPLPGAELLAATQSGSGGQTDSSSGATRSGGDGTTNGNNNAAGSDENGNAQNLAVVYVSETPVRQIGSKFRLACGLLCLSIALQSWQILCLFAGGPLFSLVDIRFPTSSTSTWTAVQRVYYLSCLASQLIAAIGLFLRSPLVLTFYGALQVAATVAGAALWSSIDIDVVVIALSLANRFASSEISFLLMPHAFVAAPI